MTRSNLLFAIILSWISACTSMPMHDAGPVKLSVIDEHYIPEYNGTHDAVAIRLKIDNQSASPICFNADEFRGNFVVGIRVYENGEFIRPRPSSETIATLPSSVEGIVRSERVYLLPKQRSFVGWAVLQTMYDFDRNRRYEFRYTLPILNCDILEQNDILIPASPTMFVEGVADFQDMDASKEFTRAMAPDWAAQGRFIEMDHYKLVR